MDEVKRYEVKGELLERLRRFAREKHIGETSALRMLLAEHLPPLARIERDQTDAAA